MVLNSLGYLLQACWQRLPHHFSELELDAFVVMPNHIHGIIGLGGAIGRGEAFGKPSLQLPEMFMLNASPLRQPDDGSVVPNGTQSGSMAAIVQNFKSVSTRRINQIRRTPGTPVWQRNYYEHIIRDEAALQTIRQYIHNNPATWVEDQLHPGHPSKW
jgi:putative transposase